MIMATTARTNGSNDAAIETMTEMAMKQ